MAVVYRAEETREREFADVLKGFDDTEQRLLLDAMLASTEGGVPMEEAMEGWKATVEAHRAESNSS